MKELVMPDQATATRRLRVFRYKRGSPRGEHFELFDVPIRPRMTLLDALLWIKRHRDRSLAVRHSCLHASCGMCGVRADGRERLACVTAMDELTTRPTIEPLANLPVLTDLVADMRAFHKRLPPPHPVLRTSETPASEPPSGHATDVRFEDCIECGLCVSACPVVATAPAYAGPAALAAAQRLREEPRGADPSELLSWAARGGGVWSCHAAWECTQACPAGVNPAARIMALRGDLVWERS
jgi:succinate dehydrogenase / fumarate reductase iron-sulfur subunit